MFQEPNPILCGPDLEAKDFYLRNHWQPITNYSRQQLNIDEWYFINIGLHSDFRDMKKDIVDYLKNTPAVITIPAQSAIVE